MRSDEDTRPLAGRIYCPTCGYANPSTQTYCTSCGKRIKSSNAIWKIAVVALALIAGLSWAAYLFSNSITQPEPSNKNQPQGLLGSNSNTTPLSGAMPSPTKPAEPKPSAAAPTPALTTTPTPVPRPTVEPTPEEPDTHGNPNIRVWVNTDSGVYHCPGTRWYGNTKYGEYMTQKEAQESGDRPAYGNYCR